MTCYSVQPRDQRFAKGYELLLFTKNNSKNTGRNFSGKYSQKLCDQTKLVATDAFKIASKKQFIKNLKKLVI